MNTEEPKMKMQPLLLSAEQVAQLLGCSVRHVRRLSEAGQMPRPCRVGKLLRWSAPEVIDWVSHGCQRPETEVRNV